MSNYLLRQQLFKKYKQCRACGNRNWKNLVVHHLDYSNLGKETFKDIILLCEFCHNFIHKCVKGHDKDNRDFTLNFIKADKNWIRKVSGI